MTFKIVNGDLLESECTIIAHQCNCKTQSSAGLSKAIFTKFPYSDAYSERTNPDTPGTIDIRGNGQDKRYVANMFAQYYPSFPKWKNDTAELRKQWFRKCLDYISGFIQENYIIPESLTENVSVGFPYLIGCGLAGGKWKDYENILKDWSKTSQFDVIVYKLN